MTDDFPKKGRDALIPEDEYDFEEPEISAEEWQEPPSQDDGFSDPEVLEDDLDEDSLQEELLDEPAMSTGNEGEVLYEEDEAESTPRRGKGVLLGAAAVALLVLGGGGYMIFGGTDAPPSAPLAVAQNPTQAPKNPATAPANMANAGQTDQDGITPTTAETDLSLLYQPEGATVRSAASSSDSAKKEDKMIASSTEIIVQEPIQTTASALPAPVPAPIADTTASTTGTEPEAAKEVAPLQIAKIEDIPLPVKPPMEEEPETTAQLAHEKEMPTAISLGEEEAEKGDDAELASLKEEVKKLKARNESLVKELASAQAQKSIAATSIAKKEVSQNKAALKEAEERAAQQAKQLEEADAKVAAAENENKSLKSDVERLQKELEEAKAQVARSKKVVADAKAILEKRVKTSIARAQKAAKVQKKRLEATAGDRLDQPVPETTVKTLQSPQEAETEANSVVLRAAIPDSIWYAVSKTDEDLKQASVGDVIPGIGKILTIQQNSEGWEVIGTKGRLK